MAKARIESRIKNGVVIYDVGKSQLWEWAHWAAAGAGNAQAWHGIPQTVEVMAESLAKGAYVVMELQFCSPVADDGGKPCIQDAKLILKPGAMVSTRSLREAVEFANVYRIDGYPCGDGDAVVALVEIWHIVDDDELWKDWEYRALLSLDCDGQCEWCDYSSLPDWVESRADYLAGGFNFICELDEMRASAKATESSQKC